METLLDLMEVDESDGWAAEDEFGGEFDEEAELESDWAVENEIDCDAAARMHICLHVDSVKHSVERPQNAVNL